MEKNRNLGVTIIGAVLVLIGLLSLFGNFFSFINMDNQWPLIIIGTGAVFFIVMVAGDRSKGGLAVPGSILVTVGAILYFMNSTNNWEAWSYCWALIICAVGAGVWINGTWSDQPELQKKGLDTLRTGLILFLIFGVIMEFIFSATGMSRWGNITLWAILLALVGFYLLVTRLLKVGKTDSEEHDLFWPVLMIGVGIYAALSNLGWLPSENVYRLLNLWPLLLIVGGIGLIFRGRTPWIGLILGVLVVAAIFIVGIAGAQLGLKTESSWFPGIVDINFGDGNGEIIYGSGKVVTEERVVTGVNHVELSINANMEIQQGSTESMIVTGDDNILAVLETNVSGGVLDIRYKPQTNVRTSTPLKITLTVKDLSELQLSSSGSVKIPSLNTEDFRLTISSSCNINISDIQADKITTRISSSGDATMKGKANSLELDISSSGNFDAADLEVQEADVSITSSGNATIWVTGELSGQISSSGNIYYYGNPDIRRQNLTSSGKLISKGDK